MEGKKRRLERKRISDALGLKSLHRSKLATESVG